MTTQTIINEIRTHLQENIEDVNPERTGSTNWVYTIPINFDVAQYPRIHIEQFSETDSSESLNSTKRKIDTLVQVTVFNHVDGTFDIDGDGERERSNHVLSWLVDRVRTEVNDNQTKWRELEDCSVYHVLSTGSEPHNSGRNDVIAKRLTIQIKRRH